MRVTEIFYSLQGESLRVGCPTAFVRLTGCPLRCQYCDTAYAFKGGTLYSVEAILAQVANFSPTYVAVTGGEPLAQKACFPLLSSLCDVGYQVSLETSGALPVDEVDQRVVKIMDLKTPDSLEAHRNDYDNIRYLSSQDQVKFVICSRKDYDWMKKVIAKYQLPQKCHVLVSPSYAQQAPQELAEWILADKLPVRFQTQLHKALWDDVPGK